MNTIKQVNFVFFLCPLNSFHCKKDFFQNKGFHSYYCNYCGGCLNGMTEENIQAHLNDCSQHSSKFICCECGVIYLGSGLSSGKIIVYFKETICKTSQKFSFVGSRSFYFPVFTTQHRVHQVHKYIRYFHISYTDSLQFVSSLSKFSSM